MDRYASHQVADALYKIVLNPNSDASEVVTLVEVLRSRSVNQTLPANLIENALLPQLSNNRLANASAPAIKTDPGNVKFQQWQLTHIDNNLEVLKASTKINPNFL